MFHQEFTLLGLAAVLCLAGSTPAQVWDKPLAPEDNLMNLVPDEVVGTGVIQRVNNQVPLERTFMDENDQPVVLSDLIDGELPVLLTMHYSDCPQLCSYVLTGVIGTLQNVALEPGEDFRMVTISINPNEAVERTVAVKDRYIEAYGKPGAAANWHFLRGTEADIKAVADAVGFGYVEVAGSDPIEYSHPATLIVLTPGGQVSLYLTAINDDAATLRLALVDASEGAIGGIVDIFFTNCFRYDNQLGKYTPIARRILALGAGVFAVSFGALLITFRVLENRRRAEDIEQ